MKTSLTCLLILLAPPAFAETLPLRVTTFGKGQGPSSNQTVLAAAALADAQTRCTELLGVTADAVATATTDAERDSGSYSVISTVECSAPGPAEKYFDHIVEVYDRAWAGDNKDLFSDVARLAKDAVLAMGPAALPKIAAVRASANPALQESLDDAATWIRWRADLPDAASESSPKGIILELSAPSAAQALPLCQKLLGADAAVRRIAPESPFRCLGPAPAAAYAERLAAVVTPALVHSENAADQSVYSAAKQGLKAAGDAAAALLLAFADADDQVLAGDALYLLANLPTKTEAVVQRFASALTSGSNWLRGAAEDADFGFEGIRSTAIDAALLKLVTADSLEENQTGVFVAADLRADAPALKDALLGLIEAASAADVNDLLRVADVFSAMKLTPADLERIQAVAARPGISAQTKDELTGIKPRP